MKKKVARIFEDIGGYYVCDNNVYENDGILDARGRPYKNKTAALRGASVSGYTHAVGSGCSWKGIKKIPQKIHETNWATG